MRISRNKYVRCLHLQQLDYNIPPQVTDVEIVDLLLSILDSPYANYLTRQFVLAAITKISARPTSSVPQQERVQNLLLQLTTSPELETQQRAVEFASLFNLDVRAGVLERMPPPELKATVMGVGTSSSFILNSAYVYLRPSQSAKTNPLALCNLAKM